MYIYTCKLYCLILEHTTKGSKCLLIALQLLPVQSPAGSGPQYQGQPKQNRLTHTLGQVETHFPHDIYLTIICNYMYIIIHI